MTRVFLAAILLLGFAWPTCASVTADADGVTATVTPGGGAIFFYAGVSSPHPASLPQRLSGGAVVRDTDRDGIVRLTPNYLANAAGCWFVADMKSGTVETLSTLPFLSPAPPFATRGADGTVSRISVTASGTVILALVRPSLGAWSGWGGDGFRADGTYITDDDHVANGRLTRICASLSPITGAPAAPTSVLSGDWIVGMDTTSRQVFAQRIDLRAPNPGAIVFSQEALGIEGSTLRMLATREGDSSTPVTINISTLADFATPAMHTTLLFAAGERVKPFDIPTVSDGTFSDVHGITIQAQVSGAVLADSSNRAEFVDSTPPPVVSIADTTVNAPQPAHLTLTLTGKTALPACVDTFDGTVCFSPGQTSATVDTMAYASPLIQYSIDNPWFCRIGRADAFIFVDPNSLLRFTAPADVVVTEPSVASTNAAFSVSLSQPSPPVASGAPLYWETEDGTAVAGTDYVAAHGTLLFSPGEAKTISIPILNNHKYSQDRSFSVLLAGGDAAINERRVAVTIRDRTGVPIASLADTVARDGAARIPLSLSVPSAYPIIVSAAMTDRTAAAGVDYDGAEKTVEIRPGETSATITIAVIPHAGASPKTFTVSLSALNGAAIGRGTAEVTIISPAAALPPPRHRAAAH